MSKTFSAGRELSRSYQRLCETRKTAFARGGRYYLGGVFSVIKDTHHIQLTGAFAVFGKSLVAERGRQTLKWLCSRAQNPRVPCAFKVLMIHEIEQFALRIAFRCVLHRCGSLDVHCWKLCTLIWRNDEAWWRESQKELKIDPRGEPPFDSGFWSDIVSKKLSSLRPTGKALDLYHKYRRGSYSGQSGLPRIFCIWTYWDHRLRPDDTPRYFTSLFSLISYFFCFWCGNDPSAGSPTETLLRLHLPLSDKI